MLQKLSSPHSFLPTQRFSEMKFGSKPTSSGTVFRLWAPQSATVDLLIGDEESVRPMVAQERGWFHVDAEGVGAGSFYRFRLADGTQVPDPASRFVAGLPPNVAALYLFGTWEIAMGRAAARLAQIRS